ncbi:MAG: hypothetical protein J3Q66DRAFT_441499 [Benniella sp.]|nr:MAG: hypothetical protein J3Q66DRAFT_441499 [Benniella sp.]
MDPLEQFRKELAVRGAEIRTLQELREKAEADVKRLELDVLEKGQLLTWYENKVAQLETDYEEALKSRNAEIRSYEIRVAVLEAELEKAGLGKGETSKTVEK